MIGVVENGTDRRARGGIRLADGAVPSIGGKTGTGDNRPGVRPAWLADGSRVVNRTAAFAFFIGDRFSGTIVAFVPGEEVANYKFTSALTVQVLKDLESHVFRPISAGRYRVQVSESTLPRVWNGSHVGRMLELRGRNQT